MLSTEQVLRFNNKAIKNRFVKTLSALQLKSIKSIPAKLLGSVSWDITKAIPCSTINKKVVDRYFRLLMEPYIDKSLLSKKEAATLACLPSFAIDVVEEDYVDLFGQFDEENYCD